MEKYEKINDGIYRLIIPFKDIYTTVYSVHTDKGVLLFDTATYDEDVEKYIIPFLEELNVTSDMLKYIFISHKHSDHAGGLRKLMNKYPNACIVSRSPELKDEFIGYSFVEPDDNHKLMDVLKVVTIPGHTLDSCGIFDIRTKTLISGDALQFYGIFGSGVWGANIFYFDEHLLAINKLRLMDINTILTAHDYHPCGYIYRGKEEISHALDMCVEPLFKVKHMIIQNPDMDDGKICDMYNSIDKLPTLGKAVVSAIRKSLKG